LIRCRNKVTQFVSTILGLTGGILIYF
jgi:hypothetical protein